MKEEAMRENLIESIRAALEPEASPEVRAAGATACRYILSTLEPSAAQPLASPPLMSSPQIASIVGALRGLPADQLLDLAITKLRSALPVGTDLPAVTPIRFHLVSPTRRAGS
jgi:hypothetical protein